MNIIILIVIILSAITISNFISKLIPGISSSIVNTLVGLLIGFVPWINLNFPDLNSEIFMILILAPLLFFDGQRTPMVQISSDLKSIISNSFILVIFSATFLTIIIHYIFNISWAFALIMAAIATPTDATGFNAVIQNRQVSSKIKNQLSHESMFNDASGIILLQAGTLWLSTGKVAFNTNFKSFLIMTIGGIIIGLLLGNIVIIIRQSLIRSKANVYSSQSMIYFLTPILIYIIAESLHTSGIIAVVVAGLIHNSESNRSRFISSRQTIFILQSISFITEILNSTVFLLLGIYLSKFISTSLLNLSQSIYWIFIGIVIYITLVILRFIYPNTKEKSYLKMIFSFGGVHGTVTLAMAFSVNHLLMSKGQFIGLLISEITVILLSLLIPIIIFKFILPIEPFSSAKEQRLQSIRSQAAQIGINRIISEESTPKVKSMVLYDLRDQSKKNSVRDFLHQYHQFGFNRTRLDDLKSRERQNLMILAFNAELQYLYNLKHKNPNDLASINEIYSEILYSELLMLDPQQRLV